MSCLYINISYTCTKFSKHSKQLTNMYIFIYLSSIHHKGEMSDPHGHDKVLNRIAFRMPIGFTQVEFPIVNHDSFIIYILYIKL